MVRQSSLSLGMSDSPLKQKLTLTKKMSIFNQSSDSPLKRKLSITKKMSIVNQSPKKSITQVPQYLAGKTYS